MDFINIFILSVVEGITEFVPISSTGHMIVVAKFLNMPQTQALKALEVIIQLSAILAIVWFYKNRLSFKKALFWLKVFIAFLPVGLIGFIFSSYIKGLFSVYVVAVMFILGGIAFLIFEYFYKHSASERINKLEDVTYLQAFKVGLWQVLALIPGTSRSGATILGGMASGLSRQTATEFSFLTALPVMVSAAGFDLVKNHHFFEAGQFKLLIAALIIAFLTAYFTVKFLLKFIKRHTFIPFAVYRIIFGLILLWFWFLS